MTSDYEKIKTEHQIPAMIALLDENTIEAELLAGHPAYIPPHWHRSIEMSLVLSGSVELWINEDRQTIHPGEFIFVNSGYIHQLTEGSCKNTSVMMVIISYDFLKKIYPDIDQVYFQIDYSAEDIDRIRDIYEDNTALILIHWIISN